MSDRILTAGWRCVTPEPLNEWHFLGPNNQIIGSVKDAGEGVYLLEAHGTPPRDHRKRPMHSSWRHFGGVLQAAQNSVLDTLRDFGWEIEWAAPSSMTSGSGSAGTSPATKESAL